MHKTNCMQSIENISTWEVFSSICPYYYPLDRKAFLILIRLLHKKSADPDLQNGMKQGSVGQSESGFSKTK